jgi:5-methylcytosine-specific restriction endonuclease McrA
MPSIQLSFLDGKACTTCSRWLPLSEFTTRPDGSVLPRCRACINARNRAHYWANREQARAQKNAYASRNRARIRASHKVWRDRNREHVRKLGNEWKQAHKAYAIEYARKHRRRFPERYRLAWHRYMARRKNNGGTVTEAEWGALKARYNYTCLRCGRREPEIVLTLDHVMPLSMGGRHSIENIQPLCFSCNSSKNARHIDYRPAAG